MHIMQLLKVVGMTLEQTPREFLGDQQLDNRSPELPNCGLGPTIVLH